MALASRGAKAASDDQIITLGEVKALLAAASGGATPGDIKVVATAAAPSGWLLCDGSAVSRTTYAALFAAIGTTYGAGDGSTTFALPDARGRVIAGVLANDSYFGTLGQKVGETAHVLSVGEMPSHTHTASAHTHTASTDNQGSHSHGGSDGAAGDHTHGTWTDNQGTHSHGGGTGSVGDHSHPSSSATGFMLYTASTVTRSRFAVGTTGGYAFQSANQADLVFGGVGGAGGHNHGISNDGGHTHNIGMNGSGNHTHSISTDGGHTHAVTVGSTTTTIAAAGGGAAHNVVQPTIAMNYAIKT